MAIRDRINTGNAGSTTSASVASGQAMTSDQRSEERARREAEYASWSKDQLIKAVVDKVEYIDDVLEPEVEKLQKEKVEVISELKAEQERSAKNERAFKLSQEERDKDKASMEAEIKKAVSEATAERDSEIARLKADREDEVTKRVKKVEAKHEKEIERLNAKISELEMANLEGVAIKQMLEKMKDGITDVNSELNSALVTLLSDYSEKLLGACTEVVKDAQDEITRKQREREVRLEAKKKLESKIALQAELKAEIAELEGLVVDEA